MSTFEFTDGRKLTAAQIYEAMGRYGAGEPAIQIARSLDIDGDKTNNARNNLLICTRSYHHALHARMAFLYQREKFGRAA